LLPVFGFNNGLGGGSIYWRIPIDYSIETLANIHLAYGNYNNSYKLATGVMSDIITTLQKNDIHGIPVVNVADSVNGVNLVNTNLFTALARPSFGTSTYGAR
jgi:hypothetical protein